ncbi:MAG: tetratricopeptide repeat protein [Anaerolineae bacterium]|nr:tetratricopeptide repeat protein [Anaerolineae bacterium]
MEPISYRNFIVQVSRISNGRQQYHVRVNGLVPGGTPGFDEHETCTYDPGLFVVESDGQSVNLLDAVSQRQMTKAQVRQLGMTLSDLILPGSIRERLHESLRIVRERGQRLRLRLIIEAPQLRSLPWEYLYLPTSEYVDGPDDWGFLALHPDISIVRHEAIGLREAKFDRSRPYRIVSASAMLTPQEAHELSEYQDSIQQRLRALGNLSLGYFWLKRTNRESLKEVLREPTDIFHFSGCGDSDSGAGRILLDRGGNSIGDPLEANAFAKLLGDAHVQLAVLNACETSEFAEIDPWASVAAELVRAGTAAVVTARFPFEGDNVLIVLEELYKGVLSGQTIDEAIANGRRAIYQRTDLAHRDWASITLYLRVEDGIIFPKISGPTDPKGTVPAQQVINTYVTQNVNELWGSAIGVKADSIGGQAGPQHNVATVPHIAPTPLQTALVGRDDELERVRARAAEGQKYYFYGSYGVGKTSLATELFSQLLKGKTFEDGYLWHRVSDMTAEQALESIAAYFGDLGVAKAQGRDGKVNALRALLSQRSDCLIGLDEVKDAQVARAFLDAAGQCTVILNGLRRAGIGERANELCVEPLHPDEAVRLFALLAHLDWEHIQPDQQEHIDQICKEMGNLPLAIKLTALTYTESSDSLENLWRRLQIVPTTIIPDHEEVSLIFEAAYQNIQGSAMALQMLVRMACFPALSAPVIALRADEMDPQYFLAKDKLLALGLVSQMTSDRLTLHPLLGLLAREKATSENPEMVQREQTWVADWLLAYAEKYRDDYVMLGQEHDNLTGIVSWLKVHMKHKAIIALASYLFDYLRVRGHWQEALDSLADASQAARQLERPIDQAWIRCYESVIRILQGQYELAQDALNEADRLYQEHNHMVGRGQVLFRQGSISALMGDLHQARRRLETALEWMGEQAPARDIAAAREQLASIIATQGDPALAQEQYAQALALGRCVGDKEIQARLHRALGQLARRAGDYAAAETDYQAAIEFSDQLGYMHQTAILKLEWGYLLYYQGKYADALLAFKGALVICKDLDYVLGEALALHALGNVALAQEALDEASKQYAAALRINLRLGNALGSASNQYQIGVISHRQGELTGAETLYCITLDAATTMQHVGLQAACWHQLGRIAVWRGQWEEALDAANRSLDLAKQAQARLTEVSALALLGVIQANDGNFSAARESLEQAHEAYMALNAPEATVVEQFLAQLESQIPGGGIDIPIDVRFEGNIAFNLVGPKQDIDVIVDVTDLEAFEEEVDQEYGIG